MYETVSENEEELGVDNTGFFTGLDGIDLTLQEEEFYAACGKNPDDVIDVDDSEDEINSHLVTVAEYKRAITEKKVFLAEAKRDAFHSEKDFLNKV